jgi:hypothetical protein
MKEQELQRIAKKIADRKARIQGDLKALQDMH